MAKDINTENPTSWDAVAASVQVGDRYRSLGRGCIGRDVVKVETKCNCECGSRNIDSATGNPVHDARVIVTCAGQFVAYLLPTSPVVLTDGY